MKNEIKKEKHNEKHDWIRVERLTKYFDKKGQIGSQRAILMARRGNTEEYNPY